MRASKNNADIEHVNAGHEDFVMTVLWCVGVVGEGKGITDWATFMHVATISPLPLYHLNNSLSSTAKIVPPFFLF